MIKIGYTHGNKWTDSLIEERILEVINSLGLDRFPTHSEIEKCKDGKALAVKISKSGGTKYWAKKLGYGIKDCESEFGNCYEKYALDDIFSHTYLSGYITKVGYPYDLVINHNIKIDVKVSNILTNNSEYKYHSFNLEKNEPTCDIFILYCLDEAGDVYKTYIVPSCIFYGQTQVGITANGNSRLDKYIDNWNLILKYDDFYMNLKKE